MDEIELAKQRDRYWMLCAFLMVVVILLLLAIGGIRMKDPHRAVWRNFSLDDTTRIAATRPDTAKNLKQNIH
jgi:Tfp pilus assembly protein PilX